MVLGSGVSWGEWARQNRTENAPDFLGKGPPCRLQCQEGEEEKFPVGLKTEMEILELTIPQKNAFLPGQRGRGRGPGEDPGLYALEASWGGAGGRTFVLV